MASPSATSPAPIRKRGSRPSPPFIANIADVMNRPPKVARLIVDSPGADRSGVETASVTPEPSEAYINRELSWLHFARRVMALAEDPTVPLLERVKFAGIMGMLYDEFAMKRIGGLRRRIERKNTKLSPDRRTPREEPQLNPETSDFG